ncbi:MAG TPA: hypothetical protein DCG47_08305 [Spirochaetaceae bacterium]|nr:hypothetical protein [Spirochaetaceae bacterium]
MKSLVGLVLILAVIGGILFVLNPDMDDFSLYMQNRASAQASQNNTGALSKLASGIAGSVSGLVAKAYTRKDYLVFSTFTMGKASAPSDQYLGMAKLFIKIK